MIIGSWMSSVVQSVWFVYYDEFSVTVIWLTVFCSMILNVPMKCLWWLSSQGDSAQPEQHRWGSSGCSFPSGWKIELFQGINSNTPTVFCWLNVLLWLVCYRLLESKVNWFVFFTTFFSLLMYSLQGSCLAVQVKGPVSK